MYNRTDKLMSAIPSAHASSFHELQNICQNQTFYLQMRTNKVFFLFFKKKNDKNIEGDKKRKRDCIPYERKI